VEIIHQHMKHLLSSFAFEINLHPYTVAQDYALAAKYYRMAAKQGWVVQVDTLQPVLIEHAPQHSKLKYDGDAAACIQSKEAPGFRRSSSR